MGFMIMGGDTYYGMGPLPARSRLTFLATCTVLVGGWAPLAAQTVRGRVTDRTTGAPVVEGLVLLVTEQRFGVAQFTTNDSGAFQVVASVPGRYRLQFERPGYRLLITPPFDLQSGETVDYVLQVNPLPPFALDTAVVEGQVVPRRLLGFYQRRRQGVGEFITRQEFERWNPSVVTDIVRRAQVFNLVANAGPGPAGDTRTYKILSRRGIPEPFGPQGGECPPMVYLDDVRVGNARDINVDDILAVGAIEALEFYEGGTQVPIAYQSSGSNCGVIVVWSRLDGGEAPAAVAHRIEVGAQLGGRVLEGGVQEGRVGAQASVGLAGVFEFYPAFNLFVRDWAGSAIPKSGWQALVSLRARPLGLDSPWYVGAGFTTIDVEGAGVGDPIFRGGSSQDYPVLLTGIRIPVRWARPIIEIQLLDPTHPDRMQVHVFTGLAVRLR